MDVLRVEAIRIDGIVLLFTLAIAVVTGLLFGIAPAIHASRTDLQDALKDGARTAGESRRPRGCAGSWSSPRSRWR